MFNSRRFGAIGQAIAAAILAGAFVYGEPSTAAAEDTIDPLPRLADSRVYHGEIDVLRGRLAEDPQSIVSTLGLAWRYRLLAREALADGQEEQAHALFVESNAYAFATLYLIDNGGGQLVAGDYYKGTAYEILGSNALALGLPKLAISYLLASADYKPVTGAIWGELIQAFQATRE